MRRMVNMALILAMVAGIIFMPSTASAQNAMIDLGTPSGYVGVFLSDINDLGQAVGSALTGEGQKQAVLWSARGGWVNLGTLGGYGSEAMAINNIGQVVGWSYTSSGATHAFLWTATSGMTDLGTLGGDYSEAHGINDSGQVVGAGNVTPGDYYNVHAFLLSPEYQGMRDLGVLDSRNPYSNAYDINNIGQVVGYSYVSNWERHPFLWTAERGMEDLGTISGPYGEAHSINNRGQVTGFSSDTSGQHAFIWDQASGMTSLGALGGGWFSAGWGISDSEQVVGEFRTPEDQLRAFLYTPTGGMIDISNLNGSYFSATSINNVGQIVGYYMASSGAWHPFLVNVGTPVPPTPTAQVQNLISDVSALVSAGKISAGQSKSLTSKLDAAMIALQKDTQESVNVLGAFINQIGALIDAGILSSADGQLLIDAAYAVIAQFGN